MDKRIIRFLNEHNLIQYRDNFTHFDFATFLNLKLETINELIPSASESTKLHKALVSFINGSNENDYDGAIKVNIIEKLQSEEILEIGHPSLTITKLPRIGKTESINAAIKQEPEDIETIEMLSDSDNDLEIDSGKEMQALSKKKILNLNTFIDNMDLKEFHDLDMKILFAIYNNVKRSFIASERVLLSEIIIKQIFSQKTTFQLKKTSFLKLAQIIVKTFPLENITPYYINVKYFNNPSITADRGTLYTAFNKYQRNLFSLGFPVAQLKPKYVRNYKAVNINEAELFKSDFLITLQKEFIATRDERLKWPEDTKSAEMFSPLKYFKKYKILQTSKGYELIARDAEFLYPKLKGFTSNFGKIARNIIRHAKNQNLTDKYITDLLSCTESHNLHIDCQKLLAILLLPYVLPTVSCCSRSRRFRTSALSSAVHFIRLYKDEADETQIYEHLYREDAKFITGFPSVNLKMYGDFLNINSIVVRIGVTDYHFSNPLQAIEVYFKMFLGMNLSYPMHSQHIFYFFGRIAFGVEKINRMYNVIDDGLLQLTPFFEIFNKSEEVLEL